MKMSNVLTYTEKENTQALVVRFKKKQIGRIYNSLDGWYYIPNGMPMNFNAERWGKLEDLKCHLEGGCNV